MDDENVTEKTYALGGENRGFIVVSNIYHLAHSYPPPPSLVIVNA